MNRLIYDQLKKVVGVELPDYDETTSSIIIPKKDTTITSIAVGKAYLLKLENYIINPPNGFNLHANWNKGIAPKHQYLYALIAQDIGKMIRIESYGYDNDRQCISMDKWQGWLPKKSINVIKEVIWRA